MSRRRPSGLNAKERRFAKVKTPDGKEAKIPQAKDAATYICLATEAGDWPERMIGMVIYDVAWLTEGAVVELEEMRPGFGMGTLTAYRVVQSRTILQRHENHFMQVQRWLLLEPIPDPDTVDDMGVDDL